MSVNNLAKVLAMKIIFTNHNTYDNETLCTLYDLLVNYCGFENYEYPNFNLILNHNYTEDDYKYELEVIKDVTEDLFLDLE